MKHKFLFVLLLPVLMVLSGNDLQAQKKKMKYEGKVELSYGFGLENDDHNVNLEIVNGIRFNRYFYLGAGVGLSKSFMDEGVMVPIYFDAKGYFPVARKMDFVMGMDMGTKLDYLYETSGGLMLRPSFGLRFAAGKKYAVNLGLQYEYYTFRQPVSTPENNYANILGGRQKTNHIGLKIGFVF